MPNLQELRFDVPVLALYKDGNGGCDNLGLECLPSLRTLQVDILCYGATDDDVEKAEGELTNAAQFHPNGPIIIRMDRFNEDKMMMGQSTDEEGQEPDQEQKGDVSSASDEVAATESPSC
ncbi:unnamed protein product [Urochloa humidicola]